ncbi:MAG TPA: methyltransferase domain-containing protein [Cyclobacteriaceae bacterium]|jgi:ubiquinone/menaquinone biosynthesis C-methylase UbiE|nr:methyltransferase domain-containing protein [Cyclobacteriaceae bacterium]
MRPKKKPLKLIDDIQSISNQILSRDFSVIEKYSFESDLGTEGIAQICSAIKGDEKIYEPLIMGTLSRKDWYDWNLGFLLRGLDFEIVIKIISENKHLLAKAESIAWALGEIGSDDNRIIDFLYNVCERCENYDAWWCAADALEKLRICDSTDLKKRTLKGVQWNNLDYCFENLSERAAIIGILKQARLENTEKVIIPNCRKKLRSTITKEIQNAVWLLERLRIDDKKTMKSLFALYKKAEDKSHTLKPRIIEAFGQIASPDTRIVLEDALLNAKYYRTRAYAAMGVGKIGDNRSIKPLRQALEQETDEGVIGYITQALYNLEHKTKNKTNRKTQILRWPENGMVYDHTDDWYTNAEIYDKFSLSEDPLNISLDFALGKIPTDFSKIADLGTGTGRFAIHIAENRPDVKSIYAIDGNEMMYKFLKQKIQHQHGLKTKIKPVYQSIDQLPFADASIDAVVSSWAFPSKMWNVKTCLRQISEVHRVLKPNGILLTIGWDETFRDELSELWYRFVPEPDFRRESFEEWRKRRKNKINSPRNCHLTFIKRNIKVPLLFENAEEAAYVLGFLFGFTAGEWVTSQRRCEFSINVGITLDTKTQLSESIKKLEQEIGTTPTINLSSSF